MTSTNREFLKFAVPLTLFFAGGVTVLQGFTRAGAVLVIAAGVTAILFRAAMVAVQNRGPWASAELRPRLFVLWGIGVVIVGIAWLIGG
jgi:hypothetical protein